MAILDILEAPHPILKAKAREVREDEFGEDLKLFMENMAITMYAAPGVGLAAPQVGDSRKILVADPGNNDDGIQRKLYSMANPKIIGKSKEFITYEESCLSVPDFYIIVKRYQQITVQWNDALGTIHQEVFEEFPAIVLQHEMDHLEGITLLDRSSRFRRSRYVSKRKKMRK
jgi:peptide deformylase